VVHWARSNKVGLIDLGIALGLLGLAETIQFSGSDFRLESVLAVPQVLPVAFRRKAPIVTLAVMIAVSIGGFYYTHYEVQPPPGAILAIVLGIYTVAEYRPRTVSLAILAAWNLMILVLIENNPWQYPLGDMLPGAIAICVVPSVIAWIAGDVMRLRRINNQEFARRAAIEEMEREEAARDAIAAQRARQAAADERARIARELHDVVAHSLSVMVVQAGAARRILDKDPGEAKSSISAIEATGREALVEMRRLLGIVRKQNGKEPTRVPQPALDEMEALLATVRQAGVDVSLEVEGDVKPLSPGLSLAAYRLVQEALTNVLKHSGAKRAHVSLTFEDDSLQVRIADDGRGQVVFEGEKTGTGYGLAGLKERVALFRGEFGCGNLPDRAGFYVSAKLPLSSTR
jgi:signal transduction histidine kinase